jgi:AraC-like DNA-binding protein
MEQATSFLRNSGMNVNQAAFLCGFNETSYFIKVFRRFYGTTPSEYRARISDTSSSDHISLPG